MKDMNLVINKQVIDDLVTGQLAGEQYRRVLLAIEADPGKWRDCAIAFLAEQALHSDLSALARTESQNWSFAEPRLLGTQVNAASLVAHPRYGQVQLAANQVVAPASRDSGERPRTRLLDSAWLSPQSISTAALLLLSFLIGWLGSDLTSKTPRTSQGDALVSNKVETLRPSTQPKLSVPAHAASGAPQLESAGPLQYVLNQKDHIMPLDREVPPQLAELERDGKIQLDSLDGIVPVTRDDGSFALVPVQMFRVVPVTLTY